MNRPAVLTIAEPVPIFPRNRSCVALIKFLSQHCFLYTLVVHILIMFENVSAIQLFGCFFFFFSQCILKFDQGLGTKRATCDYIEFVAHQNEMIVIFIMRLSGKVSLLQSCLEVPVLSELWPRAGLAVWLG